jgi:EPTP domain
VSVFAVNGGLLTVHQRLQTCGARRAAVFRMEGILYLAVPQLAEDVPGQLAHMNGGNSNVDTLIYAWRDGGFREAARLRVPGGEDAAFFQVGGERFLATASVRSGAGPYDLDCGSILFRWRENSWQRYQSVNSFAARQWHHFRIGGRTFLALAQGVRAVDSEGRHGEGSGTGKVLEWDGERFVEFQSLGGAWGYGWKHFNLNGETYLAYADHLAESALYRWTGSRFEISQRLPHQGGRAFLFFEEDGASWLAFATISGESILFRSTAAGFVRHQSLGGPGGREFALVRARSGLFLVRICFIQGTPAAPKTDLMSQLYRWESGLFRVVEEFPTFGGTDARAFEADGAHYLAVANSLTPDVRFRQDTVVYRLSL